MAISFVRHDAGNFQIKPHICPHCGRPVPRDTDHVGQGDVA
jgi:hypothetical protein